MLPRSADGKLAQGQEVLASELTAYPFEENKSTIVYVEVVNETGQKQRVNRSPECSPRSEEGRVGGGGGGGGGEEGCTLTSSLTETLGTFRVLFDGGPVRAHRLS